MKKIALMFIFAAQVGTCSLWAQERGEMLERMFSRMDKNGDGFVEQSEAPAEFWAKLGKADKNGDGKIDKTEAAEGMKAMGSRGRPAGSRDEARKPEDRPNRPEAAKDAGEKSKRESGDNQSADRMKQMLERFGKNGKVALADLPAPMRERLAKLDTNNDKVLDREELKATPLNEMGDPARMLERLKQMLQNLDKDGDGKIALADLPEQARDRLSRLDKNNDGQIEKAELSGMAEEMKKMEGRFDRGEDLSPQKPKRPGESEKV